MEIMIHFKILKNAEGRLAKVKKPKVQTIYFLNRKIFLHPKKSKWEHFVKEFFIIEQGEKITDFKFTPFSLYLNCMYCETKLRQWLHYTTLKGRCTAVVLQNRNSCSDLDLELKQQKGFPKPPTLLALSDLPCA